MTLKELERKGIPGKIITTDYQIFTEPKALDKLRNLKIFLLKYTSVTILTMDFIRRDTYSARMNYIESSSEVPI